MNPGRIIGVYEVVALLGKGAMGAVYRARHRELGVERALKVIPYGRDAGRRARFAREARSLAAVKSEHVVRIHEAGEEAGEVYLVMDLVEGEPLERALARGRLPVVRALELASALARGVAALHAAGIVHRDLKPENVLVRPDGAPVIVDLGLAVAPETDERLTRSGAVMGTPLFMAPEQLLGKPATSAADVYALGLIVFALTTGEAATPPFESFPELVAKVALEDRPTPSSVDPDLPAALDDLCARMLSRAPERRPRAAEVARAVDAMLAALRSDTSESARAVGRRRRGARVVGAALAALVVAVGGTTLALGRRAPERDAALTPAVATPTSERPARALPADPEAARQLRRIERVDDPGARLDALREWLARWPDHPERAAALALERAARVFVPLRLQVPADTAGAAFLDDACVVTASAGALRVWDAETGAELPPLQDGLPAANRRTFLVLPRRAGFAWGAGAEVVHLAPGGGAATRGATPHHVFSLAASDDGALLVAGHEEGTASVLDRDGRALATLGGHGHVVWSVAVSADGRHALTGTGVGVDHDGSIDDSVRLWSLERGGQLVRREGLDARVTAVAFVPGADSFLVGNTGARVYRFDLARAGPVQELASQESIQSEELGWRATAHRGGLRALAVSSDGRRAWTASGGAGPRENELRAWDLESGRERYRVLDRPTGFLTVNLSPDERRLVTWSDDGVVEVWATDTP